MWADLFARAAGEKCEGEKEKSDQKEGTVAMKRKTTGRPSSKDGISCNLRKRSKTKSVSDQILTLDRTEYGKWPTSFELGQSFDNTCQKFRRKEKYGICERCGKRDVLHVLRVKNDFKGKDNIENILMSIFVQIRNIRCMAYRGEINGDLGSMLRYITQSLHLSCKKCTRYGLLPRGETEILARRFSVLEKEVETWRKNVGKYRKKVSSKNYINERIQIMSAADSMYYRTHYLAQFCQSLISTRLFPNPVQYFSVQGLAWDVESGNDSWSLFVDEVRKDKRFEDKSWVVDIDGELKKSVKSEYLYNPLFALYCLRIKEMVHMFWRTGLCKSEAFQREHLNVIYAEKQKKMFTEEHETTAPLSLTKWRDSSRDCACNVYAYASLSPTLIEKIIMWINKNKLTVVELGAGTGYLSAMLEAGGLTVEPFDIAPTIKHSKTFNEYHGLNLPFMVVRQGGSSVLRGKDLRQKCLLLCYPPPDDSMAENCVRTFIKNGGLYFIHIGEGQGLTGTRSFELLVSSRFLSCGRFEIHSWGTDASQLTFWKLKKNTKIVHSKPRFLLCSNCSEKPPQKRCRLLRYVNEFTIKEYFCLMMEINCFFWNNRSLAYCGKQCFEKHAKERYARLLVQMISFESLSENTIDFDDFNFDNESFFVSLG